MKDNEDDYYKKIDLESNEVGICHYRYFASNIRRPTENVMMKI